MEPQQPAPRKPKPRVPLAVILLLGVLAGPLPIVGLVLYFHYQGSEARAFLRAHFADVRKDPEAFLEDAPNEEAREAYDLIARSTDESIFPLSSASGGGTPFGDWETKVCINPDITLKSGTRTIGVLVVEKTSQGKKKMLVRAISATRKCTCNGKYKPCRLE